MLAQFPDNATWLEYNAIIGADPKVPEMFTTLTFKNQMLGMCNVDTHATIEAWNQAPQMTLLKGTPLVGRSGDTTEKSIQVQRAQRARLLSSVLPEAVLEYRAHCGDYALTVGLKFDGCASRSSPSIGLSTPRKVSRTSSR